MKLLLKILAVVILGPLAAGLLLIVAVVAMVGLPLVWEGLVARFTSPGKPEAGPSSNG